MDNQTTRGWTLAHKLEHYSMPEPNSGCYLWLGTYTPQGYGRLSWNGRDHAAHRLAYIEEFGPISHGLGVLHHCDNPACVNPNHLFAGNQLANVHDMIGKGRKAVLRGSNVSTAKLTEEDARAIFVSECARSDLARRYGVDRSVIWRIQNRQQWVAATSDLLRPHQQEVPA